jgi:hypothetical protein
MYDCYPVFFFLEESKKFDVQIIRRVKLSLKEERITVDQMTNVFGDGKNMSSSFNSLWTYPSCYPASYQPYTSLS